MIVDQNNALFPIRLEEGSLKEEPRVIFEDKTFKSDTFRGPNLLALGGMLSCSPTVHFHFVYSSIRMSGLMIITVS